MTINIFKFIICIYPHTSIYNLKYTHLILLLFLLSYYYYELKLETQFYNNKKGKSIIISDIL